MAPYCLQEPSLTSRSEMEYSGLNDEDQQSQDSSNNENENIVPEEEELAGVFPPPPNALPESLPLENSLPQLLMSQCGVTEEYELTNKTSVRLRIISKDMSLQRLSVYMPSLVELDLSGSWLLSLRDLGCGLRVKILKVARCNLDCLDGLFGLSSLEELHARSNYITDIGSCALLPRLKLLDLSRNRVDNLGEISFLGICSDLTDLDLSENPVSGYVEYRNVVMQLLPSLIRLNGEPLAVEDDESNEIKASNQDDVDEESNDVFIDKKKKEDKSKQFKDELKEEISPRMVSLLPTSEKEKDSNSENKTHHSRPSTSIGIRQSTSCMGIGRLQRPHTAGPIKKDKNVLNEQTISSAEIINEENTASRLTSGGVVCGNLTAALRSRARQNKKNESTTSWCKQPLTAVRRCASPPPHVEITTITNTTNYNTANICNNNNNNNNNDIDQDNNEDEKKVDLEAEQKRVKQVNALLEASRKWREAYSKYRDTNRDKWDEEYEEENKE